MSSKSRLAQNLMPLELWKPIVEGSLQNCWSRKEKSKQLCLCCKAFYSTASDIRFEDSILVAQDSDAMINYFESHPISSKSLSEIAIPSDVSFTICSRFARLDLQKLTKFTHYAAAQDEGGKTAQLWSSIFTSCPSLSKVGCSVSAALTWSKTSENVGLSQIVLFFSSSEEKFVPQELGEVISHYVSHQELPAKEKKKLEVGIHLGNDLLTSYRLTLAEDLFRELEKDIDLDVVLVAAEVEDDLSQRFDNLGFNNDCLRSIRQWKGIEEELNRIWGNLRSNRRPTLTTERGFDWQNYDSDFYDDYDEPDTYNLSDDSDYWRRQDD